MQRLQEAVAAINWGNKERGWISKPRGSEKGPQGAGTVIVGGGEQLAALGSLSVRGGYLCLGGKSAD